MEQESYKDIIFQKETTGVARVILNRPERRNAVNLQTWSEIADCFRRIGNDADVRVVIVKGAGSSFCSGHDAGEKVSPGDIQTAEGLASMHSDYMTNELFSHVRTHMWTRWQLFWELPQPIIAQVHGHCVTEGTNLALSCDLVYAAENAVVWSRTQAITGVGGWTETPWPITVGIRKAKEIALLYRDVTGKEAAEIGMVNAAFPEDKLEQEVEKIAKEIARLPVTFAALNKAGINKFFEALGMRHATETALLYHAMGAQLPQHRKWRETIEQKGVRAARAYLEELTGGR